MTKRTWLVTGCSSGLGRALAEQLAADGEHVLATARDAGTLTGLAERGPHVLTTALDVRDDEQCAAAVALAVERFGRLDVLVNNAGYGQFGVVEELTDAELTAQFDTNVYGPWRLLRHALPHWRAQGGGHAVFSSSVSASVAFPGLSAYTASKFALDGLAEALAAETRQFGVKVTLLQLGMFATSYGDKVLLPGRRIDEYQPLVSGMLDGVRALNTTLPASPPALFAEAVKRVVAMDDPPMRLPVGPDAFATLEAVLAGRQEQLARGRLLQDQHRVVVEPVQGHGELAASAGRGGRPGAGEVG